MQGKSDSNISVRKDTLPDTSYHDRHKQEEEEVQTASLEFKLCMVVSKATHQGACGHWMRDKDAASPRVAVSLPQVCRTSEHVLWGDS